MGIWWSKGTETLRLVSLSLFLGLVTVTLLFAWKLDWYWSDSKWFDGLYGLMAVTSARRGSSERAGGVREDPWAVHRHENVGFWWTVDGLIQMLRAHESNSTTEPCQTHETWKVDKLFLVSTILLSALWSAAAGYLSWCERQALSKRTWNGHTDRLTTVHEG